METEPRSKAQEELAQIIESARALGVEMDEQEAIQWLTAVAAAQGGAAEVVVDAASGMYGHRVALLDFDPADLERLRRVAAIVEIPDRPNVETAIALSGSSAQSRVQTFPGDFDYFERVNIKAATREEACRILGEVIREKALSRLRGPGYQLTEVRFGTYQHAVIKGDERISIGGSICWAPAEVEDGRFDVLTSDGQPMTIGWDYACRDPGWCKLDWVLVDPGRARVVKASNMLDVTWEAPDGSVTPLDGFIDPYFQEVYLEAESIPLFTKIIKNLNPQALQKYVADLENEVRKYTHGAHANFGKAAKRMYNIFRLTGRYEEAAYVRELFDEPAALLYQVGALMDGLQDLREGAVDTDTLLIHLEDLIRSVIETCDGPRESKIVMALLRLRDMVMGRRERATEWVPLLLAAQEEINALVNEYFEARLRGLPQIDAYLDALGEGEG